MKRVLAIFLVVTMLFSLAACSQKAEATWQEQYDLGVRYLNEGKYEEAVIAFNAAIEIDPKQADAYIGLAEVYTVQGDTDKAREVLEQALEKTNEDGRVADKLAELEEFKESQQDTDASTEPEKVQYPMFTSLPQLEPTFYEHNYDPVFDWGDSNRGAVGGVAYNIEFNGASSVADVELAAAWSFEPPAEQIEYALKKEADRFKEDGINTGKSVPMAGGVYPVWPEEVGKTWCFLYISVDENCEPVGYTLIHSLISTDGSTASAADLPAITELTYFGQSPLGLTAMQLEELAAQNGYYVTNNQNRAEEADYYWFRAAPKDIWGVDITGMQYDSENRWSMIAYTHYYDYAEYAPISIGLRDIYTLDSISAVFTKLGVPNGEALAQRVEEIRTSYTCEEARNKLGEELGSMSYHDNERDIHFIMYSYGNSTVDENGAYYFETMSVELQCICDGESYCINFEFTNGVLTMAAIIHYWGRVVN